SRRRRAGCVGDHRVSTPLESRAATRRRRAANQRRGGIRPARARARLGSRLMRSVAVIGAGSWGTALAVHLGRLGHEVRLWGRDRALIDEIRSQRVNAVYLPDIMLPDSVSPTSAMSEALAGTELVIVATPSHGCRTIVHAAAPHMASRATVVSAAKGLESDTL